MQNNTSTVPAALNGLLMALGRHFEIEDFGFEADGSVALTIENDVQLELRWAPHRDRLLALTDLGPLPQADTDTLLALLQANYEAGVHDEAQVGLSRTLPPRLMVTQHLNWRAMDEAGFVEAVENHLELIDLLRNLFANSSPTNDASGPAMSLDWA